MISLYFGAKKVTKEKALGDGRILPQTPCLNVRFVKQLIACYKVIFYLFHWQEVLLSDKKSLSLIFCPPTDSCPGRPAPFNRDDAIRVFPSITSRDNRGVSETRNSFPLMAKRILKGRPVLLEGKRSKKIDARFTEDEYKIVLVLEKELGVSKTDLVRRGVLNNASAILVNAKEMLRLLDSIGLELARSGNNINQLARYANILNKRNILSPVVVERFNHLFESYLDQQKEVQVALRKVLRLLGS